MSKPGFSCRLGFHAWVHPPLYDIWIDESPHPNIARRRCTRCGKRQRWDLEVFRRDAWVSWIDDLDSFS